MSDRTKFMVTGGAGFIGSALCRHLGGDLGLPVLVVDKLTYSGNLASLEPIAGRSDYHFAHEDICDRTKMLDLLERFEPDIVVNLAAESHADRSIDDPAIFIETNIVGTFSLLEACRVHYGKLPTGRRSRFRFHHVSTDEVFGQLPLDGGRFSETTPYAPSSPYSASKAASDHLALAWHRTYGLPVVLSNCCNNYGPYQFPEKLIPLMILNALAGKPLPVYGRGENVRDWIFVEDHVLALVEVARNGKPGQCYNVGADAERSNIEVVEAICGVLDARRRLPEGRRYRDLITFVDDRPGHDLRYAVDSAKLRDELGWTPRESFESGLDKTISWYMENERWWRAIRD